MDCGWQYTIYKAFYTRIYKALPTSFRNKTRTRFPHRQNTTIYVLSPHSLSPPTSLIKHCHFVKQMQEA